MYLVECPLQCGTVLELRGKPVKTGSSWPHVRCSRCAKYARVGFGKCVLCRLHVRDCDCCVREGVYATRHGRQ
eukprot:12011352-Alexandrium_andersonii.AAC.1